ERMREGFTHLGYPSYFRLELAVAKILGVAALLLPCPAKLKEWAYAGFTFTLISAFIAHLSSGDDASRFMMPVVMGAILYASYVCLQKLGRNNLF
ncbi:MAG TPA: DoxX family protein, partial [bacterium]|nr:DoxX family protein [bacterium]